jgi:hypothetical protein
MAVITAIDQGERFRGRSTHINVRVHSWAQLVEAGVAELVHVRTDLQMADGLTKPFHAKSQLQILFRILNDFGTVLGDAYDVFARAAPESNT